MSEKLVYTNDDYWIRCFQLIRKIIGGVDYKGVREIMRVSLNFCFLSLLLLSSTALNLELFNNTSLINKTRRKERGHT